jgi:hypothetical protein
MLSYVINNRNIKSATPKHICYLVSPRITNSLSHLILNRYPYSLSPLVSPLLSLIAQSHQSFLSPLPLDPLKEPLSLTPLRNPRSLSPFPLCFPFSPWRHRDQKNHSPFSDDLSVPSPNSFLRSRPIAGCHSLSAPCAALNQTG